MPCHEPILHLVCGKIAAGKSTLCNHLGTVPGTVLIREDYWLTRVFPDTISTLEDYVRCSNRIKDALGPHVVDLLGAGLTVVLDFPGNTPNQRAWMRDVIDRSSASHRLHYLDVPDAICKARLRARNERGNHEFTVSDEQFDTITRYFAPPSPDEGFDVVVYGEGRAKPSPAPD